MSKDDARGYTSGFITKVRNADPKLLGVRVGLACIAHNVSVIVAASKFGVSRQTIYRWFMGVGSPDAKHVSKLEEFLATLKARKV